MALPVLTTACDTKYKWEEEQNELAKDWDNTDPSDAFVNETIKHFDDFVEPKIKETAQKYDLSIKNDIIAVETLTIEKIEKIKNSKYFQFYKKNFIDKESRLEDIPTLLDEYLTEQNKETQARIEQEHYDIFVDEYNKIHGANLEKTHVKALFDVFLLGAIQEENADMILLNYYVNLLNLNIEKRNLIENTKIPYYFYSPTRLKNNQKQEQIDVVNYVKLVLFYVQIYTSVMNSYFSRQENIENKPNFYLIYERISKNLNYQVYAGIFNEKALLN